LGYRFADIGLFKKPSLQLNVANLFDQQYERISSGSGSSFTQSTPAFFYMGAPRFTSLTFRTEF
jgi:iron complex outermembrane receptor protein